MWRPIQVSNGAVLIPMAIILPTKFTLAKITILPLSEPQTIQLILRLPNWQTAPLITGMLKPLIHRVQKPQAILGSLPLKLVAAVAAAPVVGVLPVWSMADKPIIRLKSVTSAG